MADELTTTLARNAWRATPAGYGLRLIPGFQRWRHIRLVSQEVARAFTTADSRTIITLPNQCGKSYCVTLAGLTWALDHWPALRVGLITHTADFSEYYGRQVRDLIVQNPQHLRVRVKGGDGAPMADWQTTEGGGLISVGVGGNIMGRPLDALIIDDPFRNWEEAHSERIRQRVWEFFLAVALMRLQPGAPIIIIMTRLHEDDLVGRLTNPETNPLHDEWRTLWLPQIAVSDDDPLGRKRGEVLEPRRFDAKWVNNRKQMLGSYLFSSLQQGQPSPAAGKVFLRRWWKHYERHPARHQFEQIVTSWDMSFKDSKTSDYVCGQVWARRGGEFWLLDQVHGRMEFTEALRAVVNLHRLWPDSPTILVEEAANGAAILSQLRAHVPGLVPVTPMGSKEARARAVAPYVEAGNVFIPTAARAPWVTAYVEELAAFPTGANDDMTDATSQALMRLSGLEGGGWMTDYQDDRASR